MGTLKNNGEFQSFCDLKTMIGSLEITRKATELLYPFIAKYSLFSTVTNSIVGSSSTKIKLINYALMFESRKWMNKIAKRRNQYVFFKYNDITL